jgi:uracil-DNA glycosylase
LRAINLSPAKFPFAHGARHALTPSGLILFDSYHCSRYNTNTGVLTEAMFRQVFGQVRAELDDPGERG